LDGIGIGIGEIKGGGEAWMGLRHLTLPYLTLVGRSVALEISIGFRCTGRVFEPKLKKRVIFTLAGR